MLKRIERLEYATVAAERPVRHFGGRGRDDGWWAAERDRRDCPSTPSGAVSQAGECRAGWATKLPYRTGQGSLVDPW